MNSEVPPKKTSSKGKRPEKRNKESGRHTRFRYRLSDHLIQGFLIFASVFVAFWLNDYRNQQVEKKVSRAALEAVVNEIRHNKAVLQRWAPRHKQMIEQAEFFIENSLDTMQVFDSYYFTRGQPIFQEIITYDSWDFIRQTNTRIDLNDRLLINRIYRQQNYVENALNALTQGFFSQRELFDKERVEENYVIFCNLIMELYGQEMAMIREYKVALEELKSL